MEFKGRAIAGRQQRIVMRGVGEKTMANESCEVCGTNLRVGKITVGSVTLNICVWCHEDEPKLKAWFMREMEAALEASPDYRRLSDGRWTSA